jgi:hypothetical protein
MKKIVYILLIVVAIVFVSGRTLTSKNNLAESKPAPMSEFKTAVKTSADSPRIHFMLHKNTGQANWSPALWWSYDPAKMDGC